jgi:hypothetical protein
VWFEKAKTNSDPSNPQRWPKGTGDTITPAVGSGDIVAVAAMGVASAEVFSEALPLQRLSRPSAAVRGLSERRSLALSIIASRPS